MPQPVDIDVPSTPDEVVADLERDTRAADLASKATELARGLSLSGVGRAEKVLAKRCHKLQKTFGVVLGGLGSPGAKENVSDDYRWLYDNVRLLYTELQNTSESQRLFRRLPQATGPTGKVGPRIIAVAEGVLTACEWQFSDQHFSSYLNVFQQNTVLHLRELWALVPSLKLVLLEKIASLARPVVLDRQTANGLGACVRSLRDISQAPWKDLLQPQIVFDSILDEDPASAYTGMDFESRNTYRTRVMEIAERCDASEMEVATQVIALARDAQRDPAPDPRVTARRSHVGFYLTAEGAGLLHRRVGFRPSLYERIQVFLHLHPDEFYLASIEVLTFLVLSAILLPRLDTYSSLGAILFTMLLLLLPCSQSAVQVMNYLATSLLPPRPLPKLDFSEGIPDDCPTLVAVPALLLSENQVHRLVDDLEVRFLGNRDRNLHFALVTDLPDSRERPSETIDPLVVLCARLVRELNEKYENEKYEEEVNADGPFLFLHRDRVYNPHERVWMGWERKRGKLMDLNKLLRQGYDSFPVKAGDLSVLPKVRFVITLDADTELPRGSAQRMVGTLAHPLNQAIVDPEKNIVIAGYGILQPRVGVSVQSAAQSRLANIYSGQTGFDIYTRAVSDVYQDLYGEGSFAGKGIYEVDTVHRVLDRRFPHNALLSHDLIEGAYARAGLVSDIEIIEDYPSHYSAYNRRKHRWLRGDWQIAEWLFPQVPNEVGDRVRNPISLVSQWKILDNLRRSLVEPATLLLLVMGWVFLPGPARYWTLATIGVLFVPAWCQFVFNLVRAVVEGKSAVARDAASELFTANVSVFLTLTFLAHQTMLSLDAVVRTLVRRITQRRLLEWETAAQAEIGARHRTPVDVYQDWVPVLAIVLGLLVFFTRRSSFAAALPILLLWAMSKMISSWLDRPPRPPRSDASRKDELFLRRAALRTWTYFSEFSNDEHHWLVPDNVQEGPYMVAARVSPTNIGLLLNCRQVACEFGYLTVPEFAEQTQRTMETIDRLPRHRGHLLNWYDTRNLTPLTPLFVSSVDSGNFLVSLWTLQQGCTGLLKGPVMGKSLAHGLLDHVRSLADLRGISHREFSALQRQLRGENWLRELLGLPESVFDCANGADSKRAAEIRASAGQARQRLTNILELVRLYAPWQLPEFAPLMDDPGLGLKGTSDAPTLEGLENYVDQLIESLTTAAPTLSSDLQGASARLLKLLPDVRQRAKELKEKLQTIVAGAERLSQEMDFKFLIDPRRKLLSIGSDVAADKQSPSCYDLLASEARTAVFAAIAKNDIPQETWFLLGRSHTMDRGRPVLLSWTGTMFEYLMPSLWMRVYPGTLLERSRVAAVRMQQEYARIKRVPWGISESAYAKRDEAGNYQYRAFGLPWLALHTEEEQNLVVSPYSTFLALHVDAAGALRNLRSMAHEGWFGKYGFYESVDFSSSRRRFLPHRYEVVHCWMAHHQGMSLLSIANLLQDDIIHTWFHGDPRVQATELLLHEKPVAHVRPLRTGYASAA